MKKACILVVEDEAIVARDIQSILKSLGYNVPCFVSCGSEAIKKVELFRPDLVLMDIVLKGDMDGIQTANEIKKTYGIPIVYLTAYCDENTLKRAKLTEPYGYILKPFDERELYITTEMALYKHKTEKERKELINTLEEALARVKQLSGLLPICASCKKIRDSNGNWTQVESYIREHSEAHFSHGMCNECAAKLYPQFFDTSDKATEDPDKATED